MTAGGHRWDGQAGRKVGEESCLADINSSEPVCVKNEKVNNRKLRIHVFIRSCDSHLQHFFPLYFMDTSFSAVACHCGAHDRKMGKPGKC